MPYSQQFWHKYEVSASLGAPTYSANEQLRSDQWAGSNNVEQWTGTSRMPAAVISRSQLPMSQPQFAAPQYLQGGSQQPQLPTVLPSYDRDPQMDNIVPTGQVQGISYNPNRFRQYLQGNAPPQGVAPMQR